MNVQSKSITAEPTPYQQLLNEDTRPVPEIFRRLGNQDIGPMEIPTEWYLSRAIHEREVERIWKRKWQATCREEDIPEVGDTWVYDIVGTSLIIVRSAPGEIKAFYNACLHRGRALRECPGRVSQLKCPYHGFSWALDGRLNGVPAREEFPQVNSVEFRLPEVKVGVWGGFVFINMDPESESLEDYIGELPDHFTQWPLDDRTKTLHIAKRLPCNWKLAHEAFLEAFHVNTTHPQFLPTSGEQYHQLDTFGNFSRGFLGLMKPSAHLRWKPTPQEIFNAAIGAWDDDAPGLVLPEDTALRPMLAQMFREQVRPALGDAVDAYCDAEMIDVVWYSLFPNFIPYAGFMGPLVYRFFPDGDDHERCVMEIMVLSPKAPGQPSVAAPFRWVEDHESFMAVPELGFMAPVLNQDTENLSTIMTGLRNNQRKKVVFAAHHELKIRHFYHLYQQVMELENPAGG